MYNLFGRQRYPKSNLYDYYIVSNINNNQVKIPISDNREIIHGNEIIIKELNNEKLKVSLYKYDFIYIKV